MKRGGFVGWERPEGMKGRWYLSHKQPSRYKIDTKKDQPPQWHPMQKPFPHIYHISLPPSSTFFFFTCWKNLTIYRRKISSFFNTTCHNFQKENNIFLPPLLVHPPLSLCSNFVSVHFVFSFHLLFFGLS